MFGESGTKQSAEAPYKLEAPVLDVPVETPAETPPAKITAAKKPRAKKEKAIETNPVTVTAKYKKSDLQKMSKKELMELVQKHSLEVKSRTTKEELVKVLLKV
jgi:hypothetical protein